MTLQERSLSFATAFPLYKAAWPTIVQEQRRDVLYATWVLGNDYRAKTPLYGAYPPGYLARMDALFPEDANTLHAFSGSLPEGPYARLDLERRFAGSADGFYQGSVYDAFDVLGDSLNSDPFELVYADPPYSAEDAKAYGTAGVDRRRALSALATVTCPGGHLVWLDCCWPMHRKAEWLTVGRIAIVRSTNHRVRMATIFERQAA